MEMEDRFYNAMMLLSSLEQLLVLYLLDDDTLQQSDNDV